MKNILITGLLFCFVLAACRKNDDTSIYGQKPEERMNQILNTYKTQLTGSPNGWRAYLYPGNGRGYGFYFKFADNNRVNMLGDFTAQSGASIQESSYRMQSVQRPSLFFDTYNYLHQLADPDGSVNGGPDGTGLSSDFEFGFDSTRTDTIRLTGNVFKSQLILIKASKAEEDAYKAGQLNNIKKKVSDYLAVNSLLNLQTPVDKPVQFIINRSRRVLSLLYEDSSKVKVATYAFAYGTNSLFLDKPLVFSNLRFQEVFFDETTSQFYFQQDGKRSNLVPASKPAFPLSKLIGITYSGIRITDATLVASSASFVTAYKKAQQSILAMPYNIYLKRTDIIFDVNAGQMVIDYVLGRGAIEFHAPFPFSYILRPDGTFKFMPGDVTSGNSQLLIPSVAPINNKFASDRFSADFYTSAATGLLGQLISQDDTQYFMAGALQ
ncbi:DUF4302 domain-containing protein [Chitinophaga vietnamensis]|uniref:DUF4302 domain-containing protein n=1 Tax=Chitinophaga vietnamensis TaxID=2593957 RepID=UPI0011787961|nr:DUF4302 domain-containing protein [Chitinophaga vietnamensis]